MFPFFVGGLTMDEMDVLHKEAFERWVSAPDDFARRTARRDLDIVVQAWNAAWEVWAARVGLPLD